MRTLSPGIAGFVVLVALWPLTCMSEEDVGITSCQSVLLLPLPWRENADTWGMVAALVASVLTYLALRHLLRHPRNDRGARAR